MVLENDERQSPYRQYLDGQAMYSNGGDRGGTLTDKGWIVPSPRPATDHERMVGAAMMRRALVLAIESGQELNGEMARELAHFLLMLNDGHAVGVFVPLVLSADGVTLACDLATPETVTARVEIARCLNSSRSIPETYRTALVESMTRADRGRLTGLAAPGKEAIRLSEENSSPSPPIVKPLPMQRFQENEILRVIKELGYDAKSLPKWTPGKAGIKSEIRSRFTWSEKVFDLAWSRLREQGELSEMPSASN